MKKLLSLATAICLLLLTCACAAGGTTAGSSAASQPAAPSPSSTQAETPPDSASVDKPKITFWFHVSDNEEYLRNLYTSQLEPVLDEIDIEFVGVPVDQYENKW